MAMIIGVFLGRVVFSDKLSNSCTSSLKLIKPNMDCETYDNKVETLNALKDGLSVSVAGFKKTGKAKRISVFVRDLKTSRFAGVDDDEVYYMASLLKTPVIIGGYKLAEVEPRILDQEVVYTGKPNLYDEQVIKSDEMMRIGSSYKIKELMRRAVVYSDNTAAQLLYDYYPNDFMDRIMQALGIQLTRPTGEKENLITARIYSNVFRILYNASYLTKEYSNETLLTLTKTAFNKGATAKLPKDVVVAHKFAERTVFDQSKGLTLKQFHECGIVYAKKSEDPYIFCIMTEGDSYEDLESVVADLSLSIYEEMVKE